VKADTATSRPSEAPGKPYSQRVLVVGLDGATWDVLGPLAASGTMPNLAHLMARAQMGVLQSTRPYITPVAWATFLTGCDPHEHGILDYRYLDHVGARLRLGDARRLRAATILEAVSAAGGEVVSLNLPMTYPPAQHVSGIVVGGLDSPSIEAALAPYPRFAEHLARRNIRLHLDPIWRRRPRSFEEIDHLSRRTEDDFHSRAAAAGAADGMTDWRLMIVQFQALDALSHRAWPWLGHDPSCSQPRWVASVTRAMRGLDQAVGDLLELAERRGADVVALSDHGFGPFAGRIHTNEILARRGLVRVTPRGSASYAVARGAWKLRKVLRRLARPGRGTKDLSRPLGCNVPIDWKRTAAVTLHGSLGALVYLNSPERFDTKGVSLPREKEQVLADVDAAFREARHPETGAALFDEVFTTADRLGCDPLDRNWPDLVAIPAAGYHTRHHVDPQRRLLSDDDDLAATHRSDGVLLVGKPGASGGACTIGALREIAPWILGRLGVTAWQGNADRGEVESRRDQCGNAVEARLRALGYVE
jgi:predicted AlkP superfamily phosphohydrolase/phosphomutase